MSRAYDARTIQDAVGTARANALAGTGNAGYSALGGSWGTSGTTSAKKSGLAQAREQLEAWEAKKPGEFHSDYEDKMAEVNDQLAGMKDFSYDPTRDAAYQQYKNSYTRQAKLANENAQANASAISGGYGSSYGTQAGQSAYQNAMDGLNSAVNGLYSQALNQYTQKKSDLGDQYDRYHQAYTLEKGQYDTAYQNWQNQLNYYQNAYSQALSESESKKNRSSSVWGTILNAAATIGSALLFML